MTLRINLCEDGSGPLPVIELRDGGPIAPSSSSVAAFVDWCDDRMPALQLFLVDEPEFGKRCRYVGVDWEIVDYHDGWVARLLVD